MPPLPERGPLFSVLEYAPGFVVYALHGPYWLYLMLRYRGIALPAIANPSILVGGLVGESKTDQHALLDKSVESHFAPFVSVSADDSIENISSKLNEAGLQYPLVAKPDVGRNGRGVKIVQNVEELTRHLALFPPNAKMIIQKYIEDEGEAGVFYVRRPGEEQGTITSLTLKYFPRVVGDGTSTLRELILRDPRASRISWIYMRRNRRKLDRVIPKGEEYRLVSVGNHVRGSIFTDGAPYITEEMTGAFDRISKGIKGFYFGRYDVRFKDIKDLQRGKNFTILEFNGASSEPTHVWDKNTSVWKTFADLLYHWKLAFEIGALNRDRGTKPIPLREILKVNFDEITLVDQYPDEE